MNKISLFSAGAGTGKTHLLASRIVAAIGSGTAPEKVMAITFTNRAADELISRVRQHLLQSPEPGVQQQALRIADAYIGTIDSICVRLLREFAFEAGISPAISIIPEEDVERIFRLSSQQVIGSRHAALAEITHRLSHDGAGDRYHQDPDWQAQVRQLVDQARLNSIDAASLSKFAETSWETFQTYLGTPLAGELTRALARILDRTIAALEANEQDTTKTTRDTLEQLRKDAAGLARSKEVPWNLWRQLARVKVAKKSAALVEELQACAASMTRHSLLQADIRKLIEVVFDCAAEAMAAYEAYKRSYGLMDFVDLEDCLLGLLEQPAARERLAERLDLIMVDEFQDTSPIQLALFTRLSGLAGHNLWVGDQKQAVYGFRGTDPALMDAVVASVDPGKIEILDQSWRSVPELVRFSNTLFTGVFNDWLPAGRVQLQAQREPIPDSPTVISLWRLADRKKDDRAATLASRVKALLDAGQHTVFDKPSGQLRQARAGDIAILCRTNSDCTVIASALADLGIAASAPRGELLAQPECVLVLAGLRLLLDDKDTLALAEIVHNLPGLVRDEDWLAELVADRDGTFDQWRALPPIARLLAQRDNLLSWTPLQALEAVIDQFDIIDTSFSLGVPRQAPTRNDGPGEIAGGGRHNPAPRLANLDRLRQRVQDYQGECATRHEGASLAGMLAWLAGQEDPGQPPGSGENTVQVLTYHGAKGLEWPLVILYSLDAGPRDSPFEVKVVEASCFDAENPLAGRGLRYWPSPFGHSWKGTPLEEALRNSPEGQVESARELAERSRLMYVGMTRARDYLILAAQDLKDGPKLTWLEDICDRKIPLQFPDREQEDACIGIGDASFRCDQPLLTAVQPAVDHEITEKSQWYLPADAPEPVQHTAWSVAPSSYALPESHLEKLVIKEPIRLGERIRIPSGTEITALGQAVHAFLACDRPRPLTRGRDATDQDITLRDRQQRAGAVLEQWGVDGQIPASGLVSISDRLDSWISARWPDARLLHEWPLALRINGQYAHGWADLIIETDQAYILIDHKSFPGKSDEAIEKSRGYAGQLFLYRQAIEGAMNGKVMMCAIHYAIQGIIVPLDIPR